MASNNFINECKRRANENRLGKIIVGEDEITNTDNLQRIEVDGGCYVDGNIIGTIYIKCLNSEQVSLPNNIDLIDKEVEAQIGVKYDDSTTEYISLGKYKVERPTSEQTAKMSQFTAYDLLVSKIDNKYVCGIDYSTPKTLSDLYIDVCTNLDLIPVTTTFINSTIPITANPFTNGEKNRFVLQTIAKIACSYITIDNDNDNIDLSWLSDSSTPDYTFQTSDYSTLEGSQIQYGPVNSVTIKNSEIDDENVTQTDQASIEEFGEHSVVINEDYILNTAELRQQAITEIFNRLNGLKYLDSKLSTYYGKPFLKIGDKIRIYKDTENYFDTYVLKHKFTYDGTFNSVIESPALTEQQIETKQELTLKEKLNNTQIKVDKQKQRIDAVVETQDGQASDIAQIQVGQGNIELTVASQTTAISDLEANQETLDSRQASLETTVNGVNIRVETLAGTLSDMNYNFSTDSLKISNSSSKINSEIDNTGLKVYNYTTLSAIFTDKGSGIDKLIVTGYAQIGYLKITKVIKNSKKVTQIFALNNLIEDLTDLESE